MELSSYQNFLKTEYPSAYEFLKQKTWKPVFFSEPVPLSKSAYSQMEKVVQSLFKLKKKKEYQQNLKENPFALQNSKQDSVLMAYDFHIKAGQVYLIEVNTNASAFLIVNSLYQMANQDYVKAKEALKQSFQKEWEKFKGAGAVAPKKTVLIDEDPLNQKMALEFFMYQGFFQSMNWSFEICDSQSLEMDDRAFLYSPKGDRIDFIYNRSTDFYFENHPLLKKAYIKKTCAFSPHPLEYYLLADKERLCEWQLHKNKWEELKQIQPHLPHAEVLTEENKDQIWKDRKKYFFKVKRGHGGKLAYRGSSLSRKKFEEMCRRQGLVQEYIPAGLFKDSKGEEWKTDFRAYVYEDQIQQLTARCYQGQLTNFQKEGSGFARVFLK